MKVHQLEQFYKDNVGRLKVQMKKQEKERMDRIKQQIREEEKVLYEKKLQEVKESRNRELRLVQDEITRITEQAVRLKEKIELALGEKEM